MTYHGLRPLNRLLPVLYLLLSLALPALGQQVSATLAGVVKDTAGAVVPGAKVTIVNQSQGVVVREVQTETDGSFVIYPLNPAKYTVVVEMQGFKKFEQRDLELFANDRVFLPPIVLDLGALTESITVQAATVQLQTQSTERSGVITGSQTANLALNGRNYLSLTALVPGVLSTANNEVAGPGGIGSIFANGQRGIQNSVTLDGATNMDTGANGTQLTSLNIDAVAEFRVLTGAAPADFGRVAGAAINIVTRGGAKDFHGTGYWYHRHEGLNANTWRNNADGLARKIYRFNTAGYNLGGPVYLPGKLNRNKDKLFFFWAEEWQKQLVPYNTQYATVPTAAERQGDFSATHDESGKPVIIKDPLKGGAPFDGNRIPLERLNADGQKILNYLPLPNVTGNNAYNFQSQVSAAYPRRQEMARVDWNISDKWRVFFRAIFDADRQEEPYGLWASQMNIPLGPMSYNQPGQSGIVNVTTVINPTLTNEFIFGPSRNRLTILPTTDGEDASKMNLSVKMLYPNANIMNLVPGLNFGGISNAPNFNLNNIPFYNVNDTFDFTDNLSKVQGAHQFRVGFYVQRSRKDQTSEAPINGYFYFDRDSANPLDSNWAFSNALLGNYQRFQQSNTQLNARLRYTDAEWYAGDTWRVRQNLTLIYGMRFYIQQPQYDVLNRGANFDPSYFDRSQAAVLYQKAKDSAGKNAARNPLTGQLLPAVYIGALVPGVGQWSEGAYVNGLARAGEGYPRGIIRSRGVHYAPRLGLAWQITPKTVFRTGGGVYYERVYGTGGVNNPPLLVTPTIFYSTFASLASAGGTFFPGGLGGFAPDGHLPTNYQWNAGLQRELPANMVLDVAYIGSVSNHQIYSINRNGIPFGAAWLPQNQDPTAATAKFDGTTTSPINFLRPYQGYADINQQDFGGTANYNALQVGLNRRMATGLQLGVAYTWSHALGLASTTTDAMNPVNMRVANYGPLTFDRRHMLVVNCIYEVPKLAKNNFLDNPAGRAVFNNWQVSGIGSFISGQPDGTNNFTYTVSGNSNLNRMITGSDTWGPRVVLSGSPVLDKGSQTWDKFIDTSVFHPAAKGSLGMDSAQRIFVRPGVNNWDLSVFKSFPLAKETTRLQLRIDMFNALNHTQWGDFNRSIQFDSTGKVANLPTSQGGGGGRYGFGALTVNRSPRIVQLAARISF